MKWIGILFCVVAVMGKPYENFKREANSTLSPLTGHWSNADQMHVYIYLQPEEIYIQLPGSHDQIHLKYNEWYDEMRYRLVDDGNKLQFELETLPRVPVYEFYLNGDGALVHIVQNREVRNTFIFPDRSTSDSFYREFRFYNNLH